MSRTGGSSNTWSAVATRRSAQAATRTPHPVMPAAVRRSRDPEGEDDSESEPPPAQQRTTGVPRHSMPMPLADAGPVVRAAIARTGYTLAGADDKKLARHLKCRLGGARDPCLWSSTTTSAASLARTSTPDARPSSSRRDAAPCSRGRARMQQHAYQCTHYQQVATVRSLRCGELLRPLSRAPVESAPSQRGDTPSASRARDTGAPISGTPCQPSHELWASSRSKKRLGP